MDILKILITIWARQNDLVVESITTKGEEQCG